MPIIGTRKEKPKNTYFDLIFPQRNPLFASQSKSAGPGEENIELVITDPNKLKKILSYIMEGEGSVHFRRNERGGSYYCQIKLINGNKDPLLDETIRPQMTSTSKTDPDKQTEAFLIVHNIVPLPDERQMQPQQNITIMFSFYGWHYRADVVVLSSTTDGWILSYPDRLTKIGKQRDCFRATVNNTDTCIYVIREAGCYVEDPDVQDVGMGGCSFMASPDEATMAIGSRINISLEWGDTPEERNTLDVGGLIRSKSGNGLYHVAFTGIGPLTKEATLLGNLVASLQTKRLSQTSKGCEGCTSSTCIKTTLNTSETCENTGGSTSSWIPR